VARKLVVDDGLGGLLPPHPQSNMQASDTTAHKSLVPDSGEGIDGSIGRFIRNIPTNYGYDL